MDWRLKVFCPAFLQKSGRGPGAEPLDARRSARNAPFASQSAGGGQRGNPRRGFPLCGRPPPPAVPAPPWGWRWTNAGRGWNPAPTRGLEERGKAGGGRREGSSGTPTPTGPCGTGRVPRDFPGAGHNAGNGENAAGGGVLISFAGRRGRRPLRGWRGSLRWRVCLARYLFTASQRGGVPSPPLRRFTTHPILK